MTDPARSHGRKSIRASLRPRELITPTPEIAGAWTARVITLLPQTFPGVLGESLTGRALQDGLWALDTIDLRPFGEGRHRNVDDTPAGGGAGMVLRADVMGRAIDEAMAGTLPGWPLIYLSPRGRRFDQAMAQDLSQRPGVTLICGRFEGLDERVIEHYGIDATVRLLPGVLGNAESAQDESHSNGLLEHPQYTRPAEWMGRTIPEVLTSGDHAKVEKWRREMSERLTAERRPDLWESHRKSGADKA